MCMCVYSNSRNDVPRVAQRYGTIAAHTRRRAPVLVVFVVFCAHMHSFAGRYRRRSVTLQSPTATLIPIFSSSELTGCGYPGLLDWQNRSDVCPRLESNHRLPTCKASTLSTRPDSPLFKCWDRSTSACTYITVVGTCSYQPAHLNGRNILASACTHICVDGTFEYQSAYLSVAGHAYIHQHIYMCSLIC